MVFRTKALPSEFMAVALVAGAALTILPVQRAHQEMLFPIFTLAVVISSLFGTVWSGLLASALAAVTMDYLFTAPYYSLWPLTAPEAVRLAVFSAVAVAISGLVASRRRAEARLGQAQRDAELTAAATRLKDGILAKVSHEIRTPLTAIAGFSELLCDEGQTGAGIRPLVATIERSTRELTRLVEEIHDLANADDGKLAVFPRDVALPAHLTSVMGPLARQAHAKGLNFALVIDGPVPATIHTDPIALRQILEKIVGNSIKFTDRGFVRVTARFDERRGELAFTVDDSGVGVLDANVAGIFEPFSTIDMPPSHHRGAGLSLAWSRLLARKLAGDVKLIASTSGVGSTFEITVATGPLGQSALVRVFHDGVAVEVLETLAGERSCRSLPSTPNLSC